LLRAQSFARFGTRWRSELARSAFQAGRSPTALGLNRSEWRRGHVDLLPSFVVGLISQSQKHAAPPTLVKRGGPPHTRRNVGSWPSAEASRTGFANHNLGRTPHCLIKRMVDP
jgi:hypothetical protein